jgi:CDGSH-type Zn-finger protein
VEDKPSGFHIRIIEKGPYRVSGGIPLLRRYRSMSADGEPLEWEPVGAEDKPIPTPEPYLLCRCGQSAKKPFCDGTHARGGFVGALSADRMPRAERCQEWRANGIVLTDDRTLCASAGFCHTLQTDVWQMVERAQDPEVRARLLCMVSHCDSGRLVVTLGEDGSAEPEYRPSIAVVRDGPLWVRGGIPIEAPDGFVYEVRNRVTLCRCGQSWNQPFCDGMHERINLKSP